MTRLTKLLTFVATCIISLDVLLMVINGTIIYVILTMVGFYLIALLAFKRLIWKRAKHWLSRKRKQRGRFNEKFTRNY